MLLLALDTSTRQVSIALCSEKDLFGEYTWHVGNNHSVELLQRIRLLLAECSIAMSDIDAVAVARGPGSFNGLRVALATSKALAFAIKKPIVGICTLDLIAAQQRHWNGIICSILEAGRNELYAACYRSSHSLQSSGEINYHLQQLSDYLLLTPEDLSHFLQEQAGNWIASEGEHELSSFLFCGEISIASHQALHTLLKERSCFASGVQSTRYASTLALLALQRLQEGKIDDPLLLEPLYIRHPSITTSTRKQPLLGSKTNRLTSQSKTEREDGALRH